MLAEKWFIWALLSAMFAALTAICAKVGMEKIDSDYGTLLRTFVIVPCLALFVGVTGKWQNPFGLAGKTLLFLTLSGLATGASWVCYYRALKDGKASEVAPVDKLSVVLVAVFAVVFLGERLTWQEWCGVGLVALGVFILAFKWSS
jgi:transporter family protein